MPGKYDDDYAQAQAAAGQPEYYAGRGPGTSGAIPLPPNSRLQYQETIYQLPTGSAASLFPPNDRQDSPYRNRPRSQPPPARRRRADRELRDEIEEDLRHPVDKARRVIDHTFSNSNSGLGVGVLGAIVGGLIAREASAATANSRSRSHGGHGRDKAPLISTVVGAAVGGLAANALEKRIEVARAKTAQEEDAWERKWGRDSRGRKIDRYEEIEYTGRRPPRTRSSGMLYEDYVNDGTDYGRSGR